MKPLQPIELQLEGIKSNRYHIRVDPKQNPPEDIWRPQFWVNCAQKLSASDIIRIEAADGSYDFCVKVVGRVTHNGKLAARVEPWPILPQYVVDARDAATELVPTTINGKPLPRVEATNADGWRVIGLDGQIASKNHLRESDAMAAMADYLTAHGITSVADRPATDIMTGEEARPRASLAPNTPPPARDPNLSVQKHKDQMKKDQREAQRAADLKALAERKAGTAAETA